jgi:membrane-bound lytic murein transglycosylase B
MIASGGFRRCLPRSLLLATALVLANGSSECRAQEYATPARPTADMTAMKTEAALPAGITEKLSSFVAGLWPDAEKRGVAKALFDQAFQDLTPDPEIFDLLANQPEHVASPWDYLARLVSARRIEDGRRMLATHAATLAQVESRFGVDRHVVVAIWGIESNFGAAPGTRQVIRSLATLAVGDPRRPQFWRGELLAALTILQRGDTTLARMTGSWAGAMGHTQFMPSSYLANAVDLDQDGRRDIWDSVPDALASTAAYLKSAGWKVGEPWGYEVVLPAGFNAAEARDDVQKPAGDWAALGIEPPVGRPAPEARTQLRLILPAGIRGPGFLVGSNFRAILRYNNSVSYALAIGHLANRIAGGAELAGLWPTDDPPLDRAQRLELQRLLSELGLDVGVPDGIIGSQTRAAVRAVQVRLGLPPDGYAGRGLINAVRDLKAR